MKILVDTREQAEFLFLDCKPHKEINERFQIEHRALTLEGSRFSIDYSVELPVEPGTERIGIERKSLSDLCGTLGGGRETFEAKLEHWRKSYDWGYRALVIEGDFAQITNPNAHLEVGTGMHPNALMATLMAYSQRFDLHIWPCPTRKFAEQLTFKLLERWYRDRSSAKDGRTGARKSV